MDPGPTESQNESKERLEVSLDPGGTSRWRAGLFFLILALLFHLLLYLSYLKWGPLWTSNQRPPPPVELRQVDPKKLEAIRKQWKSKGLLLDQNPSAPSEKEPPPNASYESDRNIRVEKEQRAAETAIIPKPGHPNDSAEPKTNHLTQSRPKKSVKAAPKYPSLGTLGVPLKLDSEPKSLSSASEQESPASSFEGGHQYIRDKNLPVGSEDLLNTQETIFYSFYERLYEAIGPIWQSGLRQIGPRTRLMAGEYTTTVDVILDEKGNLIGIRRLQSSGVPEFDNNVDQSWQKIQRFPNPPQGLLDKERQVHIAWSFRVLVGEGFQWNVLPPERTP